MLDTLFPNACYILLLVALCQRLLPRNEWLSATVICFTLGVGAIAAQATAATAFGIGGELPPSVRVYWTLILAAALLSGREIARDLLSRPKPPAHPTPEDPDWIDWANRQGRFAPDVPEDGA